MSLSDKRKPWWMILGKIFSGLILLYLLLSIPLPEPSVPAAEQDTSFLWEQDELWRTLEVQFQRARQLGCLKIEAQVESSLGRLNGLLGKINSESLSPENELFDSLESEIFHLGPSIGACPSWLGQYISVSTMLRQSIKDQSRSWDIESLAARRRIYRLLYGARAAVEEVMLQAPVHDVPPLVLGHPERSATPAATVLGVTIHSGDILISRGGAPTSALIARGNDYPGNFSHVALVHVDEKTNQVLIIESHIERGVAIASLDEYLRDKKLRVMVLRLRSDLPQLVADPLLPHQVATSALERARRSHTAYDFAMDFLNPDKLFCSEVASVPYREAGVILWMGISQVSLPGVRAWLAAFGVRHFKTQEPSDLEYDPQLTVVAEWRDPETLYQDHLDNAVIDVLLEGAEAGERLGYPWYKLGLGRIVKGYSVFLNLIGKIGPVPEGMSAAAALRNMEFSHRHHLIRDRLINLAAQFKKEHGYTPPYWSLVALARQAKGEMGL